MKLSEERLNELEERMVFRGYTPPMPRDEFRALIAMARGTAALEDMLREWVDSATFKIDPCDRCGGTVGSIAHTRCIRTRTEALLAEGDE